MNLNNQGKNELRKKIEEQLQNVPEGQRVHLDKELLDDLIFFKGKNKDGLTIKIPVWTGKFLRKIDLSELSFENVCFYAMGEMFNIGLEDIMDAEDVTRFKVSAPSFQFYYAPFVRDDEALKMGHESQNDCLMDFSGTNINIDFSKIYGAAIENANFAGVDLSKSNFQCVKHTYCSNFSNTGVVIDFESLSDKIYRHTNFSYNDFSQVDLDSYAIWYYPTYSNDEDKKNIFSDCNYSNTGLKIKYIRDDISNGDDVVCQFKEHLKNGWLEHCFIDGKKITSPEEREMLVQEKKAEYEKFKEDIILATTNSIEQQVSGFGRK